MMDNLAHRSRRARRFKVLPGHVYKTAICLIVAAAVLLVRSVSNAELPSDSWYFSASEIESAYGYQEHFGRRLSRPLEPNGCYFGQSEFAASFQEKPFSAPCRFIFETTRHIKQLLEQGAAKFLFPLDADHAHLAVPTELFEQKYRKLSLEDILPSLLREPQLVALYHTAEHLSVADSKTGKSDSKAKEWRSKRNVLGFYDGRPIKILPELPGGAAYHRPPNYETVAVFYFLGHRLGELALTARGKAYAFDLSFDDDSAVPMNSQITAQTNRPIDLDSQCSKKVTKLYQDK